jgi:hypothetical protein
MIIICSRPHPLCFVVVGGDVHDLLRTWDHVLNTTTPPVAVLPVVNIKYLRVIGGWVELEILFSGD